MHRPTEVVGELAALVGADVALAADSIDLARHRRDFGVQGDPEVPIIAVVLPRDTAQVSRVLRYCNERRIAVQPQGGMSGLSGGGVPVGPCVILSMERMRAILSVDRDAGTMTVEAGAVLEVVQRTADEAGFFFPLDLGGRGSCQIGGNISTNAGGNRVLRFGMTRDLVLGLQVVLADGIVVDGLRKMIKNNAGYDLRQLFVGSEGTLGVVTAAVLRLFPKPRSQCTGLCAVRDYAGVLRLLGRAREAFAADLSAFEVMWPAFYEVGTVRIGRRAPLPMGAGVYVLVETLGTDPQVDAERFEAVIGSALEDGIVGDAIVAQSQRETNELWSVRDSPGDWHRAGHWPQLSFDVSVPTGEIDDLVREIDAQLSVRWPDLPALYFGHVADGNLHVSVGLTGRRVPNVEIERVVYDTVSRRNGSISAEHGIGSLKREFLYLSRSPAEIAVMRALKNTLDPNGILNPGKIF